MKRINTRLQNKKNSNLKLISSTIKNISNKGINETTMHDVSQGAGLSQGIVNFHFKSKELLLIETLKYISNEYLESFQKFLNKHPDHCKSYRDKIPPLINLPYKRTLFLDTDLELIQPVNDVFKMKIIDM